MEGTVVRILHFSDFHLSGDMIKESANLIDSLVLTLKSLKAERNVDFVIFTGDAILKGGEGFSDIREAFGRFKEVVVLPIISTLGIGIDRFIMTPGNHDLDFKADDMDKENDIDERLKTEAYINKFVSTGEADDSTHRMDAFKDFEHSLYSVMGETYQPSRYQSNLMYNLNGVKVCITSLNSSWRCNALDKGDRNRIVVGTFQILQSLKYLNESHLKIAVAHHHPSFLLEEEQVTLHDVISSNYHLYFCGHLHRPESGTYKKMGGNRCLEETATGSMATSIYEDNAKYRVGFQIVDVDASGKIYTTPYTLENYVNFKPARTEEDTLEDLQQNLQGAIVVHPTLKGDVEFEILKQPSYIEVTYEPRANDPARGTTRAYITTNINSPFSQIVNEAFAYVRVIYRNDNDFPLYNCILTLELKDGGDGDLSDTDIVKGMHIKKDGGVVIRGYEAEMRIGTINPHYAESMGTIYIHRCHREQTASLHWRLSTACGVIEGDIEVTFTPVIKDTKIEYSDLKYGIEYKDYISE